MLFITTKDKDLLLRNLFNYIFLKSISVAKLDYVCRYCLPRNNHADEMTC